MISFKELKNTYGFKPKKSLGQNFLHSIDQARKIVKKAGVTPETNAFEIGGGTGVLTRALWEKAAKVVTIEIDRRLFEITSRTLVSNKVTWILADALKFDFSTLKEIDPGQWHALSNLPYSTSVPILLRILKRPDVFSTATLMFQKEVAERLTARPGTSSYGSLTVHANYFADIKYLMNISPSNFLPRPKVSSTVLQFQLKSKRPYSGETEKKYLEFVELIFHYRRKQLGNIIKTEKKLNAYRDTLIQAFEKSCIDLKRRPETLSEKELRTIFENTLNK